MQITSRKIVITSLLAIAILVLIAYRVGVGDLASTLRTASPSLVALSVLVYLISWPLRGVRYQQILISMDQRENLSFLVGCISLSQSANVILPARLGDVTRAYLLKKMRGIPFATALSSLAVERIFDVLAITAISILALWGMRGVLFDRWVTDIIITAGVATLVVFVLLILFLKVRTTIGGAAMRFLREIAHASTNPRAFVTLFAGSLAIWFFDILTCFVILNAFSGRGGASSHPVALVFLAIAIGNLAKIFPITPGAIGTYEGVLTLIFSFGGIDPGISFATALLDHAVKNSVTLVLGSAYLSHFGLSWTRLVEQE